MTSVFAFLVWCFTSNLTVHKTPLPTTRPGLQSRDWSHSRREFWRTHFRPCWSVKTRDLLRDWSEGHAIGWLDMTSEVAFFWAGRSVDALKAETGALCRCVDEFLSSFRDKTSELAIHNPHYRQQSRVCKGGTDITFYWEVGWTGACRSAHALQQRCLDQCALKILKNASLASDEKQWILELGWCDWCFTAEKSVPVRSEEIWRIHLMLLMKKH